MSLDTNDLNHIEKMFNKFHESIKSEIQASENRTKSELRSDIKKEIFELKDKLAAKIDATENRIITTLNREIVDLAEINHEVIKRVDKVDKLENRVTIVETKLNIKPA